MDDQDWTPKAPAFMWYCKDWLTDIGLRRCSLAARGLWADALSVMWLAPIKGKLEASNRAELCRLLYSTEAEISHLIDELIETKVASSDGPGSLISRRMYRQAKLKQTRSKAGRKGGRKRVENSLINSEPPKVCLSKEPSKRSSKFQAKTPSPDPDPYPSTDLVQYLDTPVRTPAEPKLGVIPSPVVDGCLWFRMSDHEKRLAEAHYRKNRFPDGLLEFTIQEVEGWMVRGSKKAARDARKNQTHYQHLYASWAIDKAMALYRVSSRNGNGSVQAFSKTSISARNEEFFRNAEAKLKGDHDEPRADPVIVEVTSRSIPDAGSY